MKIAIIALACLVACVSAGVHRDEPNIDIPSDKVSNLPTCTRKNIGSFHKHQHPLKYWECIVKKLFLIPYYYPAERDCKAWTFFSEKCGKCVRNPFNCDEKPEKPEPEPEPEEPILEPEEPEVTDAPTEEPPVEEVTEESPEDSESGSDSSESGSNSSESGSDSSESGSNSSESGSDSQEDSAEPIDPEDPELEPTDAPVDEEEPELEPTDAPVPEESGEVEPTDAPVPEDSGEVEPTDAPVPEESGEVEPTDAPVSEESGEVEPVDPEDPSCEVRCVRQEAEGNHVEEYYADPESCDHFWQCSNSVPHKFACPQGLIWNPTANPGPVCDWPRNYQCTEKPGCQAPEPQPDPCEKPVCSEHVDQDYGEYHSNPADCESYYQCTQNDDLSWSPTLMPCPKGLQWNSALDTCDWPAEAKCTVTCSKHKGIFF